MEVEESPGRDCRETVVKIRGARHVPSNIFPFLSNKFSDPEIEELYQLHSTNRKKTELFRCFLYALLFYTLSSILIHTTWLVHNNQPLEEGYPQSLTKIRGRSSKFLRSLLPLMDEFETPHYFNIRHRETKKQHGINPSFLSHHSSHIPPLQKENSRRANQNIPSSNHPYFYRPNNDNNHLNSQNNENTQLLKTENSNGQNEEYGMSIRENLVENEELQRRKREKFDYYMPRGESLQEITKLGANENNFDNLRKSGSLLVNKIEEKLAEDGENVLSSDDFGDIFREEIKRHGENEVLFPIRNQDFDLDILTNKEILFSTINDGDSKYPHYVVVKEDKLDSNNPRDLRLSFDEPASNEYKNLQRTKREELSSQLPYYSDSTDYTTRTESGDRVYAIVVLTSLALTLLLTIIYLIFPKLAANPHVPLLLWFLNILLSIILRSEETSLPLRIGLGWTLLEVFLIWVTVPLRFRVALIYNSVITITHTVVVVWRGRKGEEQPYMGSQVAANLILLLTTNVLGILSFYLSDKKQRRAFLDTRQSLEMKLVIEEQAKEQERLLLSVLPEHLALKMRQDLGEAVDGQFKKIYMSRHENVSILYADIVGFTAISSTYSASELVKILNELFARFDRLADKYHQIRIKILGDCYYCICGAPEERLDHAVLCVYMGLSMVKAIKYVRETTNSPVDMRVGIHTGAILAGVLGQRQWQFDVYSKDVELANKMESSGMPGRVHISETTLSFLSDEFEVEPAFGERREEILRIAGIKTYFISKVLKPFRETPTKAKRISENGEDGHVLKDPPSADLNSTFNEDSTSAVDDAHVSRKDSELESYRLRLKEELISRDGYKDLSRESHWLSLCFRDSHKEDEYVVHKEPFAGLSSLAPPLSLFSLTLSSLFIISFHPTPLLISLLSLIILLLFSTLASPPTSTINSRLNKVSNGLINFLCSLESKLWVRRLLGILTITLLIIVNTIFAIPCLRMGHSCSNMTFEVRGGEEPLVLPALSPPPSPSDLDFSSGGCLFPSYLSLSISLLLFSFTLLSQPGSWLKGLFLFLLLLLHSLLLNITPLAHSMTCSEKYSFYGIDIIPESWQLTVYMIVLFLVLFILNRRLEKSSRVLFLWKTEVEEQREHATQLRQKNEALVYNILPQHVASHFLGSRKRKHEELYSQSYSEVGILFASMPNFSDFYSEESVNNQGLECLRFLNEVISDFDAILELPKFADNIIKIKTISSTYMAASGLSPSKQAHPEDPIKIRWSHLSLLVEFALELKITLTGINEQSFNHFVLKMGINHGPLTAGVIGARKPHYDIWGNSVNVASRMESTGKAGCIQVTEETYRILKIFGYEFEQRGLVDVKGKGQLMTYYLTGKGPELSPEEVDELVEQLNKKQIHSPPPTNQPQQPPFPNTS